MTRIAVALAVAIAVLGAPSAALAKTLRAVASFTILADIVRQIGGDHVEVQSLIAPDGDPHQFEPSPEDARRLKSADIVFISGTGFERWFAALAKASGYRGEPIAVSQGIALLTKERNGKRDADPHVWNSIGNVKIWVRNIEAALIDADPADAADYRENAARYVAALESLDRYAHAAFDAIPPERRKVLTSHGAFGYFGRDYAVQFLAPIGLATESEASAADIARLIDQIKREKIDRYFLQNSNDPKLIRQIALATGAQPAGKLYGESLSQSAGPAPTYLTMFKTNVDQLAAAMKRP